MDQEYIKHIEMKKEDFMSHRFLINWMNLKFNFNIERLADLNTGVAYCRIMNRLFPMAMPLEDIDLEAGNVRAYEENFAALKKCFNKLHILKPISPYLPYTYGHLEFSNWIYKFYQANCDNNTHDAMLQRDLVTKTKSGNQPDLQCDNSSPVHTDLAIDIRQMKQLINPRMYCEDCLLVPLPSSESESESDEQTEQTEQTEQNGSGTKHNSNNLFGKTVKKLIFKQEDYAIKTVRMINDVNLTEFNKGEETTDENAELAEIEEKFKLMQKIAFKHSDYLIQTMLKVQSTVSGCSK